MAYLSTAKKCDLLVLAEEMGLKLSENCTIPNIAKLILGTIGYEEEICKDMLKNIADDRVEKENLRKEGLRREELELQKLELKAKIKYNEVIEDHVKDLSKLIPKFEANQDMSLYLPLFEKQVKRLKVDKKDWVTYLLGLLPLDIINFVAREPSDKSDDYEHIKKVLLKRFKLTPEQFRDNFLNSYKVEKTSWRDFAFKLGTYLDEWVDGVGITQFEDLKELITVDQIRKKLPYETRDRLADILPKMKTVEDLADRLDEFEVTRQLNREQGRRSGEARWQEHNNRIQHGNKDTRWVRMEESGQRDFEEQGHKEKDREYEIEDEEVRRRNTGTGQEHRGIQVNLAQRREVKVQKRKKSLKCYKCLERGHQAKECRYGNEGVRCRQCKQFGHKAIECGMEEIPIVGHVQTKHLIDKCIEDFREILEEKYFRQPLSERNYSICKDRIKWRYRRNGRFYGKYEDGSRRFSGIGSL